MRWLLDYTSQQTAGYAVWGRDTEHVEKAFVFGGMPARAGVTAAELVSSGWSGVDDVSPAKTTSSRSMRRTAIPRCSSRRSARATRSATPTSRSGASARRFRRRSTRSSCAEATAVRRRRCDRGRGAPGADGRRRGRQSRHPRHLPPAHGRRHAARRYGFVCRGARRRAHAG